MVHMEPVTVMSAVGAAVTLVLMLGILFRCCWMGYNQRRQIL